MEYNLSRLQIAKGSKLKERPFVILITDSMDQKQHFSTLNNNAFPSGGRLTGKPFIQQEDNVSCDKTRMLVFLL